MPGLGGRVIACLEARHAAELSDLVTRHGGITYQAPCLREVHEPDAAATRLAVDLICGDTLDAVVLLTGVGVQTIVEGAALLGCEEALVAGLRRKRIAARGPKTHNALRRLGVQVHVVAPEPFTSAALLEAIERDWQLDGRTVLVQLYGAPVPAFTDGLLHLGAHVREVSPYRWERPQDEEPVVRLIEDLAAGWIDVVAATSAAQIDQLFAIAQQRGHEQVLRDALARPGLRVAAQGVVCASAFQRRGIRVDLVPPRASMGALIVEIGRQCDDVRQAPPVRDEVGTVAVFATPDVERSTIEQLLSHVGPRASVAVVSSRPRSGDRLVEQVCIERGVAVECVAPSRAASHPADDIIRRAARVVILTGTARNASVGRLLRLAARYAKPVEVLGSGPR